MSDSTIRTDRGEPHLRLVRIALCLLTVVAVSSACQASPTSADWEADNPVKPIPVPPFGMELYFKESKQPPDPARVRLGRWLFFDTRLSADNTVACASCHRPDFAFSEPVSVSTGVGGQRGTRKAPSIINLGISPEMMAKELTEPLHLFWDGRAASLEEQILGPIANPIEMASSHAAMVQTLSDITGYRPYFRQAFGTDDITKERVALAIADYERTRMSGNAPYDRWRFKPEPSAVSAQAKAGHDLFFDQARCALCHTGSNFTDGRFWNLGVGWDSRTNTFKDEGRFLVTRDPVDLGAFKTPGLRDVARRAPYMHDGSIPTLRGVVEFYNRGGNMNPYHTPRMVPLQLTDAQIDAIVEFLKTLNGEGYQDKGPRFFPQ